MALTIKVKQGTSAPATGVLSLAELGFDTTNGKLYVGKGAGNAALGISMDGHTHTKSQITDFPTSMPASDVYAWAKASTKPTYTPAEIGAHPDTWTPSLLSVYRGFASALDTLFTPGLYYVSSTTTGQPNTSQYGWLHVEVMNNTDYNGSTNWLRQTFQQTDGKKYYRYKINASGWSSWYQEYSTQYKPSWTDIQSKPSVILEGDARLTDARPASDVYAWAKASTKPTYTYTEVGAAAASHTHDDRYFTETEVTNLLAGKANTSHTHAVTDITGGAVAKFIRHNGTSNEWNYIQASDLPAHTHDDRYYTESEVTTLLAGKANTSHTHTKSQITDFPTSMPASDVYAWAKASTKPTYTYSEVGAAAASHTHDDRYFTESEITTLLGGKEPTIAAGTTAQYWRGDKTWQAMPTSLPASDVYAWAKASTKPTYTYTEVGAAASSHSHVLADITDRGAASGYGIVDSTVNAAVGTSSVNVPTERRVYYGQVLVNGSAQTRATTIYAPTTGGASGQFLQSNGSTATPTFAYSSTSISASAAVSSSTAATIAVTGYRMILVQVFRNSTDQIYSFWVDLTDTTYNFNTTARNLRFRWWDGSTGWDNTITVQNSSGSLRLQHNAGGTMIFKCTGVR